MFLDQGAADWKTCVEIGPGSGKYTIHLLEKSAARVLAADISPGYQAIFKERIKSVGLGARVDTLLLDNRSATLREGIEKNG